MEMPNFVGGRGRKLKNMEKAVLGKMAFHWEALPCPQFFVKNPILFAREANGHAEEGRVESTIIALERHVRSTSSSSFNCTPTIRSISSLVALGGILIVTSRTGVLAVTLSFLDVSK